MVCDLAPGFLLGQIIAPHAARLDDFAGLESCVDGRFRFPRALIAVAVAASPFYAVD